MIANIADALHAAVYKTATSLMVECARNPQWNVRRATYIIIGQIASGCKKQVEKDLNNFMSQIVAGLNDRESRGDRSLQRTRACSSWRCRRSRICRSCCPPCSRSDAACR